MICDGYVHLIVGQDFQRFPWQYLFSIQTVVFQSYRSVSLSRSSHSHREKGGWGWVAGFPKAEWYQKVLCTWFGEARRKSEEIL